jgi:hypothetical protein
MASKDDLIATNEELIEELVPPEAFSEDERIKILAEISEIASYSRTNDELFEGCIHKIFQAIPRAKRASFLVEFHGELLPIKNIPREQSYFSETYARETWDKRKAISWLRKSTKDAIPDSMREVTAAMYVPMIRNGKVIGVLHVDSTILSDGFTKAELDLLSVIASVIALSMKQSNNGPTTPSAFISYSHTDSLVANQIKKALRLNGISVWIDERLKAGDQAWHKQLEIAIREQNDFLYLMTPACVASDYCTWELKKAKEFKKRIIPVMLTAGTAVPKVIANQQYIDFSKDFNRGLLSLIQRIYEQALTTSI